MVFEHVDKLKQEYTDKFVEVDTERPELARFKGHVGQVKTVNHSGRALVEFHEYHLNIGWYDIEVDYLKVVDPPQPTQALRSRMSFLMSSCHASFWMERKASTYFLPSGISFSTNPTR